MLQELKMKSLKRRAVPIVICLILVAGLLWLSAFGAFKIIRGPKPMDSLALTELAGQYVEAEVEVIYSGYAYTERTNESTNHSTITEREYIIPVGDAGYMGFAVDAEYIDTADALLDASYAMLTGESNTPGEPMNVKGTIVPMPKDSLEFYHRVIGYDELTAEAQQLFLPLVLKVGYVGDMRYSIIWFYTASAAVALFAAVWMLASALTGRYQKPIHAYCKASESPEATLEQLEAFYQSTEPVNEVRVGRWMMFESGGKTEVVDAKRVIWAYLRTVQHRTNGIPTGKKYSVVVRTLGRAQHDIPMKKQETAREVLAEIQRVLPHVVLGYTDRLERLYIERLQDFACLPYDAALRAELFGTQTPYDS